MVKKNLTIDIRPINNYIDRVEKTKNVIFETKLNHGPALVHYLTKKYNQSFAYELWSGGGVNFWMFYSKLTNHKILWLMLDNISDITLTGVYDETDLPLISKCQRITDLPSIGKCMQDEHPHEAICWLIFNFINVRYLID